jgi:hypothetical protein
MSKKPTLAIGLALVFVAANLSVASAATHPAAVHKAHQATAAAAPVTINWQMNEARGATVMRDSGPLGINGKIGSEVTTGFSFGGATGYSFPTLKPNTPPPHPQHLITVPDSNAIDPGTGNYSVEIRYRTTNDFGNLIQKGQSASRGGQFKIQLPKGRPSCYYKGPLGRDGVGGKVPINDGQWHVLLCVKTATSVTFYVDGVKQGTKTGPMGDVNNSLPLTIGGKPNCDQVKVTCDYFGGQVDYVKITKG